MLEVREIFDAVAVERMDVWYGVMDERTVLVDVRGMFGGVGGMGFVIERFRIFK